MQADKEKAIEGRLGRISSTRLGRIVGWIESFTPGRPALGWAKSTTPESAKLGWAESPRVRLSPYPVDHLANPGGPNYGSRRHSWTRHILIPVGRIARCLGPGQAGIKQTGISPSGIPTPGTDDGHPGTAHPRARIAARLGFRFPSAGSTKEPCVDRKEASIERSLAGSLPGRVIARKKRPAIHTARPDHLLHSETSPSIR